MARRRPGAEALDRELAHLAPEARWREWLARIEAVLFASSALVPRDALARVVGQGAPVDMLIEDLRATLVGRPYELARIGEGWMLRTRAPYAEAIRTAARVPERDAPTLGEADHAVLAAIALHQPVTRAGLAAIFGREIGAETFARLRGSGLIAQGPRSPQPGSPQSFVTTEAFLIRFGLRDLDALREAVEDAD